jgi:hypothetical protein
MSRNLARAVRGKQQRIEELTRGTRNRRTAAQYASRG